jgi:hypothetical protein
MSGIFGGGGGGGGGAASNDPLVRNLDQATRQAAAEFQKSQGRSASEAEKSIALRRRRGTRSLLSQERLDAEAGLGGQQTTLGG